MNQYEYLTSIGARVLLPAEKVGHGELLIALSSIYGNVFLDLEDIFQFPVVNLGPQTVSI